MMAKKTTNKPLANTVKKVAKKATAKTDKKAADATAPKKRTVRTPQTPRGMRDILPSEAKYWREVHRAGESLATAYGFEMIETPIVEDTSLFVRSVGKHTDIVQKEMYSFVDQGGSELTLRPEGTAPIARAYINHGMLNLPQPVKMYYAGPMFRHERPQAGRYRQFHHIGFETIGEENPVVDAELIIMLHRFFTGLGLQTEIEVNSIGTTSDRENYLEKLVAYYRSHRSKLGETDKVRLQKNPLRLLDSKDPEVAVLRDEAPQIVDFLSDDSKNHFMTALEYLDEADVPYTLNPYLVRGLDYYSHTVFEVFFPERSEEVEGEKVSVRARSAAAAGGRYDGLIEMIGGDPTPGAGCAIGVERVILEMKEREVEFEDIYAPKVFLAQLGEPARRRAFKIFDELRQAGVPASAAFTKNALKAQMEIANELGVQYTLLLGQKELLDGTIIMRDMDAGIQEIVDVKKIVATIKKKLSIS